MLQGSCLTQDVEQLIEEEAQAQSEDGQQVRPLRRATCYRRRFMGELKSRPRIRCGIRIKA